MYIHTTPSFLKNRSVQKVLLVLIVSWMSFYPIYNNYYKGLAIEQYSRFIDFKKGKSMFFNPWQYRVLCPVMIEGIYQVLDHSVFKIFNFSQSRIDLPGNTQDKNEVVQELLVLAQDPQFIKYSVVFVGFRFAQHIFIFWLAFQYFSFFVKNRSLVILGVMLTSLFLGNAVMDSDLAFNSYMDVILYLCAGLVILKGYSNWWIVVITVLGAFNRETSIIIPMLFLFTKFNWSDWPRILKLFGKNRPVIVITSISLILFVIIFIGIRSYFGYQPQTMWRVPAGLPMLKLNLFSLVSVKTYFEMYGVFGFLPLWFVFFFSQVNSKLKIFFLVIVPIWFSIHLVSVVAYQSRLFLVPTLLVFLPAILQLIEAQGLKMLSDSGAS